MSKRVNIDADQRNADWIKVGHWDLPTDKDAFLAVIGGPTMLDHFLTLPAAEAMPDALKSALGLTVQPGGIEPATTEPLHTPLKAEAEAGGLPRWHAHRESTASSQKRDSNAPQAHPRAGTRVVPDTDA